VYFLKHKTAVHKRELKNCIKRSVTSRLREGGDPALLLCTGEASPELLHADVMSSVQERHRLVGVCPEEGQKNDPKDEIPLLQGQAERGGAVQHGEVKPSR